MVVVWLYANGVETVYDHLYVRESRVSLADWEGAGSVCLVFLLFPVRFRAFLVCLSCVVFVYLYGVAPRFHALFSSLILFFPLPYAGREMVK